MAEPRTVATSSPRRQQAPRHLVNGDKSRNRDFVDDGAYRSWRLRFTVLIVVAIHIQIWRTSWPILKTTFMRSTATTPPSFDYLASHCADVKPITRSEYLTRQQSLAEALYTLNASAYIAEPGANAQFFGNISSSSWHLSERPLLLIVAPEVGSDAKIIPRVSVLTPSFETTRARTLSIPAQNNVSFLEWQEDANPYEIAVSTLSDKHGPVFVDKSIRKFIADGLAVSRPGHDVLSAPLEICSLRERKSPAEVDILRCANEVTLMAIRAVRDELHIGTRESEAQGLLRNALSSAGLSKPFVLGLFGENAALPHGSGSDRVLGKEDFVLFDAGGTLHGYNSDITRTFALPESTIPTGHIELWLLVRAAQSAALKTARNGTVTRIVDEMARTIISEAGYGDYFTHRLGHGLGIEGHEEPYLRGGSDDVIRPGHVFTDEPGVYIEGKVGVRHEDPFYVNEDGTAVLLTAAVGGQASSPWRP